MADTYLDSSIIGFNHQDALDAKVDTYRRLSPIMNREDAPAINDKFADILTQVQSGPSEKIPDAPKIDMRYALISDDPVIKANAIKALEQQGNANTADRLNLGITVESPNNDYAKKFLTKDFGYSAIRDNEDFYWKNDYMQDGAVWRTGKNVGRFLGRVIVPAALKTFSGLGYVGSLLTSIGSDNYWADVADNGFSRWFEEQEQTFKDQWIPVYKQAGFDEQGFFSKLTEGAFWTDAVADGVAFMASAAIPGMAASKLGAIGKFGGTLGKIGSKIGLGSGVEVGTWMFNTAMESAVEGAGVFKEMMRRMQEGRDAGDPRYANMSDEDMRKAAGSMAANTIAGNVAVLSLSNAFENTLFFKPFKDIHGRARVTLGEDFTAASRGLTAKGIMNPLSRVSHYGGAIGKGIAFEGLWEENAQLAIQRMNQDDAEGRSGIGGFWKQLAIQTQGALAGTDKEAGESIGLGALIGGGASVFFSKISGERAKLIENTKRAVDTANTARDNIMSFNDIYERDENNSVVIENNVAKVDPAKLNAKKKAYEEVFGRMAMANSDEYFKSAVVQLDVKSALASYVRSLSNVGIKDVAERLTNINPQNATIFGLDPSDLNESASEFATLASSFQSISKDVDKIDVGEQPEDYTPEQWELSNGSRKSVIYGRRAENRIIEDFSSSVSSALLERLNKIRTTTNTSLSQYPVDQINMLIQQLKKNEQVIASKEFKDEMSDFEKEYHINRDKELQKEIDEFRKTNELVLQSSIQTPKGFYVATDLNGKTISNDPVASQLSAKVAEYNNVTSKNTYLSDSFSDSKNGHENFLKYQNNGSTRRLREQLEKMAKQGATPAEKVAGNKYRELNPGDFAKVSTLVGKMVFGENQVYSPEELQLQQNYAALIAEMLPVYEGKVEETRITILKRRIENIKKQQESISKLVNKTTTSGETKKAALLKLRDSIQTTKNPEKIKESIQAVEKEVTNLEKLINDEKIKYDVLSAEITEIEDQIANNNFRKLRSVADAVRSERDFIKTNITGLAEIVQQLRNLLEDIKALFFPTSVGSQYGIVQAAQKERRENAAQNRLQETERLLGELTDIHTDLKARYESQKKEIEAIIAEVNKYFRDRYLDTTKAKPETETAEEKAIKKAITDDKALFPGGNNSGGSGGFADDFDGDSYLRPLDVKFFTTTFPYITNLSEQPKDIQDYFEFVEFVTNPRSNVKEKLGKNGKLRTLIVTRNNVAALGLSDVLADKKEFFNITDAKDTHIEIVPVIDDGGTLYFVDKDMNKLSKVGESNTSSDIVRRSLTRVNFTPEEEAQYLKKYKKADLDKAITAATDWRKQLLEQTAATPKKTFEFAITRGIANKQVMQDGKQAENSVVDVLVDEDKIKYNTVMVYSDPNTVINGENIVVPSGRPFIYTTNGVHEQLHSANNAKLTPEQVDNVVAVLQETANDHIKRIEARLAAVKEFPKGTPNFKDIIEKAGGIENLQPDMKRQLFLFITSTKGAPLLNPNYVEYLSSVVFFTPSLDKNKNRASNQMHFKGYKIFFGDSGISADITDPTAMSSPEIRAWMAEQFHNIKYYPSERGNKNYTEYFVKDGKIESRTWKNYATYLIADKNPDGTSRTTIPLTTTLATAEQHNARENAGPYHLYKSRGMTIRTEAMPSISKTEKAKKETKEPIPEGSDILIVDEVGLEEFIKDKKTGKTTKKQETAEETSILGRIRKVKGDVKEETQTPTETEGSLLGRLRNLKKKQESDEESTPEAPEEKQEAAGGLLGRLRNLKNKDAAPTEPGDDIPDYNSAKKPSLPSDDLFRLAKGGVFETEEDLDAVVAEIARMVPQFPVIRLKNIIKTTDGIEAWGQFVDDTIRLYEYAEAGTGYHEVFEAVANKILSNPEWRALSREFRGRKGSFTDRETGITLRYADANEHQIKEQLAEEFIDYKNGTWQPVAPQQKSYFKVLWDFIKSLFGARTSIEQVFAGIEQGKFAQSSVRAENRFARNYKIRLPELPVTVRKDLLDGATAFMFKHIFNRPESLSYLDEIEGTDEAIYEPIREDFIKTAVALEQMHKDEESEDIRKKYIKSMGYIAYTLENWKEFVDAHKQTLKFMAIKFQQQDRTQEKQDDVETQQNRNDYLQDIFRTDGKASASKSVRFLFRTLLQMQFDQDGQKRVVNGREVGVTGTKRNSVFMASLANYDNLMLQALEEFQGMNDFSRVESKIRELAGIDQIEAMTDPAEQAKLIANLPEEKATWTSLYMRVFGFNQINPEAAWNLKVKLHNYVSKHSPEPYVFLNGGGTSTIISSVNRGHYEAIIRKINNSLITNHSLVLKKKEVKGITKSVPNKDFENTVTIKEFKGEVTRQFLQWLGLDDIISKEFVEGLSADNIALLRNKLLKIRNQVAKAEVVTVNVETLNIFGYVTDLIKFVDQHSPIKQLGTQFMNITNESQSRHITPSFISRVVSEINNVSNRTELEEKFPQIASIFASDSILLSKLFDEDGNRTSFAINLGYMEGIKDLDEQEGTKSSQLEFSDKYFLQFNASLSGLYYSLPADSETEWVFNYGEFVPYRENLMEERGTEIINEMFLPKLKSEIDLAITGNANLLQLQTIHKSTGLSAANSLRFFKDILANDPELVKEIHNSIQGKVSSVEIIEKNKNRIVEAIGKYIRNESAKTAATLIKERLAMPSEDGYRIGSLNNQFVDKNNSSFKIDNGAVYVSEGQFASLVQYQKINTLLANMESFKLFFGDPAQYKDWEKRAKSMFGPIEQTFNDKSNEFNHWLVENKNSATLGDESVKLGEFDWFYNNFNNRIFSRTVDDISVVEHETLNDLTDIINQEPNGERAAFIKKFLGAYEDINEADGQSIGTLGFARHLMIKSGWRWTKEHEAYWQYDNALMRTELEGKGYDYEDEALKELDKKIVAYYKENPPAAALSPVKTLMPSQTPEGAQVLLKHSIHFMSYQVAKEFELLDTYVDMLNRNDHILNFRSVEKVGLEVDDNGKVTPYYQDPYTKTDLEETGDIVQILDMRSIGIQVETQTSGKGQTLGSQLTKLSNLNLTEAGVPTDFRIPGMRVSETIETWTALSEEEKLAASEKYRLLKGEKGTITTLENLKTKNTLDTFSKLGIRWKYNATSGFTYEVNDLSKIKEYIHNELQRLEVDENTLSAIELDEAKKAFLNPAETVPSYTTIANLLWSMADKAVTSMKVNGKPLIQVSSAFFNKKNKQGGYRTASIQNEDGKWVELTTKADYDAAVAANDKRKENGIEPLKIVMTASDLKFYRLKRDAEGNPVETLGMEVYLPSIYLKKVNKARKERKLPELTDAELVTYLNKNPKLLEGVGFRIPTQATSSLEFFTIKGFLPEAFGSAVVVPSAITAKAGSDFDVDKLNTYLNNWKIGKDGMPIYEEFRDDSNSTVEQRYIDHIRTQESEYNGMFNEMKKSEDWLDVTKSLEDNDVSIAEHKGDLDIATSEQETIYNEGLDIFRELPIAVQQQYFDKESQLRSEGMTGSEKILDYLRYTDNWIALFDESDSILLEQRDKQGNVQTVSVRKIQVVPTLEALTENYNKVLESMGVKKELITKFRELKQEQYENKEFLGEMRLQLATQVAAQSGFSSLDEFKQLPTYLQNTRGALENRYFESIRNVLKQPDMFEYLLSPNSIAHIKKNRDEVFDALGIIAEDKKELDYTRFLSTEYIAEKRNQFTKGKYDIGIFAVAMTNFANSQVAGIGITAEGGVKDSDSFVFDVLNEGDIRLPFPDITMLSVNDRLMIPIAQLRDKEGNLTMDKLSAYINGAVDVAKEPLIVEMGMHTEMAGVYTLMERMGLTGKTTALFLYQPVIRDLLREIIFLERKTYFGHSKYDFQKEIIKDLIKKNGGEDAVYDPNFTFTDDMLKDMIAKGERIKRGEVEDFTAAEKHAQYQALVTYLKLKMFSNHLLESIQGSNHDTAGVRSPYIIMKKDLLMERSKEGNVITQPTPTQWQNGTEALRNSTSIRVDVDMLKKFASLFSNIKLFALQKDNPKATLEAVARRMFNEKNGFISDTDFIAAMREYEASMIDSQVNKILVPGQNENNDVVYNELYKLSKSLFGTTSPNSLKKRHAALKKKYPNTFNKNFFLKNLEINSNQQLGIDLMELKIKPSNADVLTKELITEGMLELASFDPKQWGDLVQFYRAVVYGAYLQFGIKYSRNSFVDLIPVSTLVDKDNVLTLTDLTASGLENIDTADFTTLDEEVQRSKSHKKGIVQERTMMAMSFLSPGIKRPDSLILEKATWREGKSKPPKKSSQIFFGRRDANGDIVPFIQPAMIWGGYVDNPIPWERMPNIMRIPAIRPEYIIEKDTQYGTQYAASPEIYKMTKRGDFSWLFYQLYKKVGAEDKSLARQIILKDKKNNKSVNYLYKPINKYGSREFAEMQPLTVTDANTIIGGKSILNYPEFVEEADESLVARIFHADDAIRPVTESIQGDVVTSMKPINATKKVIIPIPTTKVISGGQTGIDRLGLEVAKALGIETGGVAPKGYKTEDGSDLSLKEFGLTEHTSEDYPARTEENIKNSDGTVLFGDMDSAGSKLAIDLAAKHKKPIIKNPTADKMRAFLSKNNIKTLNVAGNRGSKLNAFKRDAYKKILTEGLRIVKPEGHEGIEPECGA